MLVVSIAGAVTRPHYGGSLRVELQGRVLSLASGEQSDIAQADALSKLRTLVYDRLVRLDGSGKPQPALALSWEHDTQSTKWRFKLRPGVKWHDGSPFTASDAVSALTGMMPGRRLRAEGDTLEIEAGDQSLNFLFSLATSPTWIPRRVAAEPAGALPIGTGPFRVTDWQPGRRAVLQATEDYWGGRPYLDAIEVEMGRSSHEQLIDAELEKADLVELDPAEARRAQQEGRKVWTSAPVELVFLRFNANSSGARDQRLREAIAYSIDRSAIQKVLLRNYGEVSGSLFPRWLSGYAFLLSSGTDLERARKLRAEIGGNPTLKLGYNRDDALLRQVTERLAVNAHDAGITLEIWPLTSGARRAGDSSVDGRVERARIDGPALEEAVSQASESLSFSARGMDNPEEVFAAEREFLSTFITVPLVYVPELVGLGSRVRNWSAARWGDWSLDEVWVEGRP